VTEEIQTTGQLIAKSEATIASQVSGQVTAVLVDEGEEVGEGQILLEIDPELRMLEVASAEASMAEARAQAVENWKDLQRIQNLRERGATSEALLDDAKTTLELSRARQKAAEARLGLAQRALADSSVRAPFPGLISRRHVSVGEFLNVSMPVLEIVALDPIEAEFSFSEQDSAHVRLGQTVYVELAPFPDLVFEAEVTMIAPTIDPQTRTLRAKALLSNLQGLLRPGLFAHVTLGMESRQGVTMVPEESLLQRVDGTVLYRLVEGNRVERIVVQSGVLRDGMVEVKEGLSVGDFVISRGQEQISDGGVVSLRSTEGEPVPIPNVASGRSSLASGSAQ
jgi:membrane fusion protein (multidrug efflux system)